MDALVSTEWLAGQLGADDLRILDASLFLPDDGRNAVAEFAQAHIAGARFFDITRIVDAAAKLPNMLPDAGTFARAAGLLGLNVDDRIVVYDNSPHHSAARAWWTLRIFGARNVAVLDGGFAKWLAEDRPVAAGEPARRDGTFQASADLGQVRSLQQVRDNLAGGREQLVDARSASRFAGSLPEPRPGVEPGHIPGSVNLPQTALFNADGTWKRGEALRAAFDQAGVDLSRPIVTTCGSGVTAAVVGFGAMLLGARDVALYDGSWSEWGADPSTPKATGAA